MFAEAVSNTPAHRLVWAVDAKHDDLALQAKAVNAAFALFPKQTEITPVHVLRWGDWERQNEGSEVGSTGIFPEGERNLRKLLSTIEATRLTQAKFLAQAGLSPHHQAAELVRYAVRNRMLAITLSLHCSGRPFPEQKGFFEEVLCASPLPVLSCNEQTRTFDAIDTVIYVTDFSTDSFDFFRWVSLVAAEIHGKVILRYNEDLPTVTVVNGIDGFRRRAESLNLNLELRGSAGTQIMSESVLTDGRRLRNAIIAFSQRKPVRSTFWRKSFFSLIARSADCPVLIRSIP